MAKIEARVAAPLDTPFTMGGETFRSRLLVGTGKYRDFSQTRDAIEASGAQIVTVAIRRTNIGQDPDQPSLLDVLDPQRWLDAGWTYRGMGRLAGPAAARAQV